jgi:glycosyltransferase involved in cell wall biosynthesis
LADCIPHLQRHGITVVVEVDDDFEAISPRNIAWKSAHPKFSPESNWRHLARACEMADLVTVSTPALAKRYGKHGRVQVIPNFIPERYLSIERSSDPEVYLGWTGSVVTHPDDLQVVGWAVQRTLSDSGCYFAVVGTGASVHRHLALPSNLEIKVSGWVPIVKYPEAISHLDVGIVPLELSQFNHAKSWLKGLEYAALGIPFVASPTDSYIELVEHYGIGQLANTPKQWYRKLMELSSSKDYTLTVGAEERAKIDKYDFTIERQTGRWMKAWVDARKGAFVNA